MAYKVIDDKIIKDWNDDYENLSNALADEQVEAERAKLTAQMQSLGTQVEEHLNGVARTVTGYYKQHITKVKNWLSLSEKAIAEARKAAKNYKKDTSLGVPPQLQQAIANLKLWEKAIADDNQEFGEAWFGYRGTPMNKIPEKYQAAFKAVRGKLMEDQKAILITRTKIKGYIAEGEGLVKIAAKATMKAGIKAGTGVQRPITDAQKDARELSAYMAAELEEMRNPNTLATRPGAITNARDFLKNDAKNKAFTKTTANLASVVARKKVFESGLKIMRTRVASMEKVLAAKTKAFRKNELSDAEVKDEIKKANQSLKDAQRDLKTSESEAKKGLEYIAAIEKRWAAKK